jgi:hypothetical protein
VTSIAYRSFLVQLTQTGDVHNHYWLFFSQKNFEIPRRRASL